VFLFYPFFKGVRRLFLSEVIDHTIKKLKAQTANVMTLTNLSLGGFAILAITKGSLHLGLLLIFVAALADRFDGMIARKFNCESELGKQLDSMSDIISFGVAPALLIYQGILFEFGGPGMFFTVFYMGCGAFRLAKFNITENNGYFTGLPITAAGCLATLSFLGISYIPPVFYPFMMMILAFLMVSPFKLKKV
jgi:CDP-diacylglycerol--serine O-phosphatidyltransferase